MILFDTLIRKKIDDEAFNCWIKTISHLESMFDFNTIITSLKHHVFEMKTPTRFLDYNMFISIRHKMIYFD